MAKAAYVGMSTQVPVYETQTITIDSEAKLLQYFTRAYEGSYTFEHVSNGKFQSNNAGVYEEDEWYDEENDEWVTEEYSPSAYVRFRAKNRIENLYFNWSVSSEADYDFLNIDYINYNSSGGGVWISLVSNASGTQSGTCGPITLNAGDDLALDYSKDSSQDGGSDCGTISNIHYSSVVQTGTTYKDVARNVNNIYLGINNIARSIMKAYVGVGGIARPFWGFDSLAHYGKFDISNFGQPVAAASLRKKVFFGRGTNIMTYDTALTQTTYSNILATSTGPSGFSHWPAAGGAGATSTSEAIFNNDLIVFADDLAASTINSNLTSVAWPWHGPYQMTSSTSGTYSSLQGGGMASSTNYTFIGAGVTGSILQGHNAVRSVTPYSTSGTKQSKLYTAALGWPGTISNFNGCAIFSSGCYSQGNGYYGKTTITDVFDDNLTRSTLSSLSTYRTEPQCENLNNTYAVIAGGGTSESGSGTQHNDAEVYSAYGTRQVLDLLVHPDVICKTPLTGDDSKLLLREAKWNSGSTTNKYDTRIYTLDMNLTLECIHSGLLSPNGQRIEGGVGSYVGRYAIIAGGSYHNSANDGDGYYENSYPYMHAYKTM